MYNNGVFYLVVDQNVSEEKEYTVMQMVVMQMVIMQTIIIAYKIKWGIYNKILARFTYCMRPVANLIEGRLLSLSP